MNNLGNKEVMARNIQYYLNRNDKDRIDLCKDLGLKYSTVSNWLQGVKYPRIDKIELMARYFGITKADLVEDHTAAPAPAPEPAAPDFSPHDIALIEAYHDASDEIQDIVDTTLDRYSKHNLPAMGKEERRKKEGAAV